MKTSGTLFMMGLLTALVMLAGSMAVSPKVASADEIDRCGGMEKPLCSEVKTCAGLQGTKICTIDYYYFPSAQ